MATTPPQNAFPYDVVGGECPGMTLLDYFAATAMTGFIANGNESYAYKDPTICAEWAYEQAEAMMKERAKHT